MRVLISADGEGVTGVTSTSELLKEGADYALLREMMTHDVNAAVSGAFDAGATEVVVNDSHWSMTNLLVEKLDPRADLIKGFQKHLCMVEGVQQADLVFFVGYHCRVGAAHGVGNETVLGREMIEIRMNGVPVGESEINASVCAHFGVPVGMVSGDDLYCAEAREKLGAVETAITKYALGRWTARCIAPQRTWTAIHAAAQRAVTRAHEFALYPLPASIEYEIEWSSTAEAYMASLVPGSSLKSPRIVAIGGADALSAWKACFAALLLGWTATDVVYG